MFKQIKYFSKPKRKGYFFTLDAVMAMAVIAAGLIIVFSISSNVKSSSQSEFYAEDLMTLFGGSRIYQVNNEYLDKMYAEGDIKNRDMTILELVGELASKEWNPPAGGGVNCFTEPKCLWVLKNLTTNLTYGAIPKNYDARISITNLKQTSQRIILYESSADSSSADIITSAKKIVTGVYFLGGSIPEPVIFWSVGIQIEVWR